MGDVVVTIVDSNAATWFYGFILFTSRHEAQDGTGQTNKQMKNSDRV